MSISIFFCWVVGLFRVVFFYGRYPSYYYDCLALDKQSRTMTEQGKGKLAIVVDLLSLRHNNNNNNNNSMELIASLPLLLFLLLLLKRENGLCLS